MRYNDVQTGLYRRHFMLLVIYYDKIMYRGFLEFLESLITLVEIKLYFIVNVTLSPHYFYVELIAGTLKP